MLCFGLCTVCLGLFVLLLGFSGRLCSVIVALPGDLLFYLTLFRFKVRTAKIKFCEFKPKIISLNFFLLPPLVYNLSIKQSYAIANTQLEQFF